MHRISSSLHRLSQTNTHNSDPLLSPILSQITTLSPVHNNNSTHNAPLEPIPISSIPLIEPEQIYESQEFASSGIGSEENNTPSIDAPNIDVPNVGVPRHPQV